jgi:hypothetical protein
LTAQRIRGNFEKKSVMNRLFSGLILLLLFHYAGLTQGVAIYTATRQTGITFSSINSSGTGVTSWRAGSNSGNNRSYPIPIGFSFSYLGVLYTELSVSTNGFIDFSSNTAQGYQDKPYGFDNNAFSMPSPNGTLLAMAPFYDDLMVTFGFELNSSVKYLTTGTTGNKVFTLEWVNFSFEQSYNDHVNFQIKLYEADSKIEFIYGQMAAAGLTPSYTCGINNTTMSTPPLSSQLLTQQSANSSNFGSTPMNTLSTVPTSNSKIILTGCVLPSPAGTITGPSAVCQPSTGNIFFVPLIANATGYSWSLPSGFTIVSGNNTNSIVVNIAAGASGGTISVSGTNSCGSGTPSTLTVATNSSPTPTVSGPATACSGSTGHVYTTQAGMTGYDWTVSSGGIITEGGTASSHTATVTWNNAGAQTVSVNYTNAGGCAGATPGTQAVTVTPSTTPVISGNNSVCINTTGHIYSTQPGMTGYIWTISSGGTITSGGTPTSSSATVTWTTTGSQSISVNFTNSNGCSAPMATNYPVTVHPLPTPSISGPSNTCINSTNNVYTTQPGMNAYVWTVSAGGTITSGSGSSSITVTWSTLGAKTVTVNYTNTNGCTATTPATYNVNVSSRPTPTLTGPVTACAGSTGNVYTTQSGMTGYVWTVSSGGTITAGGTSTSNTATVTWNTAGAQNVTVNYNNAAGCAALNPVALPVTVNPQPTPTIGGPATVCAGATGNVYTTETGMAGYAWTVSAGGTITAGGTSTSNTVTVKWNTAGAQSVSVNYNNSFGCPAGAATAFPVTVNPLPVPVITGPNAVCIGSTGNVYTTEPLMTGYVWTISSGGTITAGAGTNAITVTWNSAGARSVSVNYTGANGCAAATPTTYPVTVQALPVPVITGPVTTCVGTGGYNYTTEAGMSNYQWNISAGGTITAGAGTNAVTVTWDVAGAQTISVTYTSTAGCNAASPTVKNVTVTNLPVPVISGNAVPCANSGNYQYTTETGMSNYLWTVSPAGMITSGAGTYKINVTWVATGAQWVRVNYTTSAGCTATTPTTFDVTVNPMPGAAGVISGSAFTCTGSTGIAYSVDSIAHANTYIWELPAGATIASGAGTRAITVNFASNAVSGNITVFGSNGCGGGQISPPFPVTVSSIPGEAGNITGLDSICPGATGVLYSIVPLTGATEYSWSLPPGATIIFGLHSHEITVAFDNGATSGNFTVYGSNECGAGAISPPFHVEMTGPPAAPVITQEWDYLLSNYPAGNQWYFEGTAIPGATGPKHQAMDDGWYWATVNKFGVISDTSNHIYVTITGQEEHSNPGFTVSPVPGDGRFTITFNGKDAGSMRITVYNSLGMKIHKESCMDEPGTNKKVLDLRPLPYGLYTVSVETAGYILIRKFIVR